ncbi:MAG: Gfo/Idh/MocA family oxidoreductase [Proteobacteria bacterium]|nr:Gfo/Idh/MocA family oxidoreductase [Pseudomonadota bacterium]
MKIKIIGAGSIGNHMAHAARRMGWGVTLCDRDPAALARTRTDIYPGRYGAWDEAIELCQPGSEPKGGFDLIVIGTPPDSHIALALGALEERPGAILVEKPFCTPDLEGAQGLYERATEADVAVFTGYDHVLARSTREAEGIVKDGLGEILSLDVAFREHWAGIFDAHPWLDGPADTYLGFWERGGGASGEHSHALNLWQHFAHVAGAGRVVEVSASLDYMRTDGVDYDRACFLNLRTEQGLLGRVVQDVITTPPLKWARIQGSEKALEWHCNAGPQEDTVTTFGATAETMRFPKTRPDDFIQELSHIEAILGAGGPSPISMERGLDTMLVVAAAHLSARLRQTVAIAYAEGYTRAALAPAA